MEEAHLKGYKGGEGEGWGSEEGARGVSGLGVRSDGSVNDFEGFLF